MSEVEQKQSEGMVTSDDRIEGVEKENSYKEKKKESQQQQQQQQQLNQPLHADDEIMDLGYLNKKRRTISFRIPIRLPNPWKIRSIADFKRRAYNKRLREQRKDMEDDFEASLSKSANSSGKESEFMPIKPVGRTSETSDIKVGK